jgi:hypothetical protein
VFVTSPSSSSPLEPDRKCGAFASYRLKIPAFQKPDRGLHGGAPWVVWRRVLRVDPDGPARSAARPRLPPVEDDPATSPGCDRRIVRSRHAGRLAFAHPCSTAHAASCARESKPSLVRMFETWLSAVRSLMTRASAMLRLDRPRATRPATGAREDSTGPPRRVPPVVSLTQEHRPLPARPPGRLPRVPPGRPPRLSRTQSRPGPPGRTPGRAGSARARLATT